MLQYPNGRGHSLKNYASVGSSPTWSTARVLSNSTEETSLVTVV